VPKALPRLRQVTTMLGVKSLELASIVTTHLVQAKDGKNVDVFFTRKLRKPLCFEGKNT
jgi:hypothetical protein